MTTYLPLNSSWPSVALLLGQIADSNNPDDLYTRLRTADARLDGEEISWRAICDEHKDEVHQSILGLSKPEEASSCTPEARLLLRIRAATARPLVLALCKGRAKNQSPIGSPMAHLPIESSIEMFPFPDCSENQAVRFLLTGWWDACGWGLAGKAFQSWSRANPQ